MGIVQVFVELWPNEVCDTLNHFLACPKLKNGELSDSNLIIK